MEVKFTKNHYPIARRVTWDDVVKKIDNDQNNELWLVGSKPTFVCRSSFTPRSIKKVKEKVKLPELHVYLSFLRDSGNFGNHKDYKNVLLVQAIGRMIYDIEGKRYCLSPDLTVTGMLTVYIISWHISATRSGENINCAPKHPLIVF